MNALASERPPSCPANSKVPYPERTSRRSGRGEAWRRSGAERGDATRRDTRDTLGSLARARARWEGEREYVRLSVEGRKEAAREEVYHRGYMARRGRRALSGRPQPGGRETRPTTTKSKVGWAAADDDAEGDAREARSAASRVNTLLTTAIRAPYSRDDASHRSTRRRRRRSVPWSGSAA